MFLIFVTECLRKECDSGEFLKCVREMAVCESNGYYVDKDSRITG